MKLGQIAAMAGKGKTSRRVAETPKMDRNDSRPKAIDESLSIKMPEDPDQAVVFAVLVSASIEQATEGWEDNDGDMHYTHVVPGFMILRDLRDAGYLGELGKRPTDILIDLCSAGFVKMAGKSWIPTCFDEPYVRGARSSKGGRSSAIRRNVERMLASKADKLDRTA